MKSPRRLLARSSRLLGMSAIGTAVLMTAAAGTAAAQTGGGGGFGGPFTSGSVQSVSGSDMTVTSSFSDEAVSVTTDDDTTYQKIQETTLDTLEAGACVRITGTGSAKQGITAESISVMSTDGEDCAAGGPGGAGGPGDGQDGPQLPGGGQGGGDGQTPPSLPDDLPEGARPPGNGNAPNGAPNGDGGQRANITTAFGTVKKATDTGLVVKATILGRPSGNDQQPRATTKRVTVEVGNDTTITETVEAASSDVTVGACVTASGVGDAEAFTAEQVTVSQPGDDGECTGMGGGFFPGGGGGGFPGGGGSTPPPVGGGSDDQST